MRLLTLDWSENWARLAFFKEWRGANGEKLDGTNNVTKQITLVLAVTQMLGLDNGSKKGIARCVDTSARNLF